MSGVYDVLAQSNSQGYHWYSLTDGTALRMYMMSYTAGVPSTVRKSIGLGDIDLFCPDTPVQIGDCVFLDVNGNGVQDACDQPIAGVTVRLFEGGAEIANTVTDGSGKYWFDDRNVPTIAWNTAYELRIDVTDAMLTNYEAAALNAGGDDALDSDSDDALVVGYYTIPVAPLPFGATDLTFDFGFVCTGSIGDRVWSDSDGDGAQDAGESGLTGVTVWLCSPGFDGVCDTADDVFLRTQDTGANGAYLFDNLCAGDYCVKVQDATLPANSTLTTANDPTALSLADGQNVTTVDFGYQSSTPTGSIGDYVWLDRNGDTVQDAGEPALGGVTVRLCTPGPDTLPDTADDVVVTSAVTSGSGAYLFTGLAAARYVVKIDDTTLPTGVTLTTANDPTVVDLVAGQNRLDVDFGYRHTGSIGDFVWQDTDNDGVQDAGEPGLDGVDVILCSRGPDGLCGTADDIELDRQTTAGGGAYDFTFLDPGLYCVKIDDTTLPAGFALTTGNDPMQVNLAAAQDYNDADFGYVGVGTVSGRVIEDCDGDGNLNGGDQPLSGVTVQRCSAGPDGVIGTADDVVEESTFTAANGSYSFTGVPQGQWCIRVAETSLPEATMSLTSGTNPATVTLPANGSVTGVDFGYAYTGAIGDRVWNDRNNDGIQDGGEAGLNGVTVDLCTPGPDGNFGTADDLVLQSAVTAGDGDYDFLCLPADAYRVKVDDTTLPAGMVSSTSNDPADVTLTSGEVVDTVDFGYVLLGSIGDYVWEDLDADALQDGGEPALGGVTVRLCTPGPDFLLNTADDVEVASAVTTAAGAYLFDDLIAGDYLVKVDDATLPTGMAITTGNDPTALTLAAGEDRLDVDFGYRHTGSIGDRVWNDTDADGVQDAGEAGLTGVTVTLCTAGPDAICGTADDVILDSQVTGGNGLYLFEYLAGGNYCVKVDDTTLPPGFAPTNVPSHILTPALAGGQNLDTVDFGYSELSAIGDRVWEDRNGDGVQDVGEPGLVGVSVQRCTRGPDGVFGTADDVIAETQVTGANGAYLFQDLFAGPYAIKVDDTTLPPAMVLTTANDPTNLALASGETRLDVDFGYQHTGSLGDRVWDDIDADSGQDAGEPGLVGVTVTLCSAGPDNTCGTADDVLLGSQQTGADGAYLFENLAGGNYCVKVDDTTLPAGYAPTNVPSNILMPTLPPGGALTNVDFGYSERSAIGNFVWEDLNCDGVQDPNEAGIPGVTVDLTGAGPDGVLDTADDDATISLVTDASGGYLFIDLFAGRYRVDVRDATVPAGMVLSSAADPMVIDLPSGAANLTADFGYTHTATLGDFIWNDLDGDGVQDAGEPGLIGVRVVLNEAGPDGQCNTLDDIAFGTATTDATGAYSFTKLPGGTYCAAMDPTTIPPGFSPTTPTQIEATLPPGGSAPDVDFGLVELGAIGDFVWSDLNCDGVQDNGERGLPGVRVVLFGAGPDGQCGTADDTFVAEQQTAADGSYQFTGVVANSYCVDVDDSTVPAGMTLSSANDPIAVSLSAGQTYTDADFGYTHTGLIGDFVWNDLDGDAAQDAGEPGISGVRVILQAAGPDGVCGTADDVPVGDAVTDAAGAYAFEKLPGATYCISLDPTTTPPGFTPTTPTDVTVPLTPGETNRDVDIGFVDYASLGDRVWVDLNCDGVQDNGEPGLPGVRLVLSTPGPDGVCGTADDVYVGEQVSGLDGAYAFTNLVADRYCVDADDSTVPPGMALSSAADPITYDLSAGEDYVGADFGYTHTGALGDFVWNDLNGDGVQDAGEPGIAGVRVVLAEAGADGACGTADDVPMGDAFTDAGGLYGFEKLPSGTYCVTMDATTTPPGFTPTTPVDPTVPLAPGETNTDVDFGFVDLASIGDRVWADLNCDGVQDAGEPGLVGVRVLLYQAGPDGICNSADDVLLGEQVTGANGVYLFTDVVAGAHCVDVDDATVPAGMVLSTLQDPIAYNLGAGEDYRDADFGYTHTGRIGDRVWNDADDDGVQDAGEPGMAGIVVNLFEAGPDGTCGTADDVLRSSATTVAGGGYAFDKLPADTYCITVEPSTVPAGWRPTTPDALEIPLTPGEDYTDADIGYVAPSSVGDRVWNDRDGDGLQDAGEPGLNGVDVILCRPGLDGVCGTGDDIVVATQTTTGDGNYLFEGLIEGTYCVKVDDSTLPPDFLPTTFNDPVRVDLGPDEDRTDVDFGYAQAVVIGDVIWCDADSDNVYEPDIGESVIPGVLVLLCDATGAELQRMTTGEDGRYRFVTIPGDYQVKVDPSNFVPGAPLEDKRSTHPDGETLGARVDNDRDDLDIGFSGGGSGVLLQFCGWWLENPEDWPLRQIPVGDQVLTREQAIAVMDHGNQLLQSEHSQARARQAATIDMSYVIGWALIGAKLNVASGNFSGEIEPFIRSADDWIRRVGGIGVGVFNSNPLYAEGLAIFEQLNNFNNGQ